MHIRFLQIVNSLLSVAPKDGVFGQDKFLSRNRKLQVSSSPSGVMYNFPVVENSHEILWYCHASTSAVARVGVSNSDSVDSEATGPL